MSKVEIRDFETTSKGENTHLYTIVNNIGESVTVCDYGATIVSLMIKDKDDNLTDVVLAINILQITKITVLTLVVQSADVVAELLTVNLL